VIHTVRFAISISCHSSEGGSSRRRTELPAAGSPPRMQWCSDAVMQWCSGAVVQWCSDAVVQWCSDAVVQWCSEFGSVSLSVSVSEVGTVTSRVGQSWCTKAPSTRACVCSCLRSYRLTALSSSRSLPAMLDAMGRPLFRIACCRHLHPHCVKLYCASQSDCGCKTRSSI
jgi:hypothetical protein